MSSRMPKEVESNKLCAKLMQLGLGKDGITERI
jgi:hypothetical protein